MACAEVPLLAALTRPMDQWPLGDLQDVDVAILDSGIDASHPDLAGRVVEAYSVEAGDEGPVLRPQPVDANNDVFGHGTAVAGIIAKRAPNARLIDVRVLGLDNRGTAACFLAGFAEAVRRRWYVINLSLALSHRFANDARPLSEAAWRQGQLVVCARRNVSFVDLGLPAEFATSIGVDVADLTDLLGYLFRSGEIIEFAAQGSHLSVPAAGGGYTSVVGTSFATPILSAVCALMVGAFPGLLPFEVRSILRHCACTKSPAEAANDGRQQDG